MCIAINTEKVTNQWWICRLLTWAQGDIETASLNQTICTVLFSIFTHHELSVSSTNSKNVFIHLHNVKHIETVYEIPWKKGHNGCDNDNNDDAFTTKTKVNRQCGKNIEIFPTPINKLWYFFMDAVVVSASLIHTNTQGCRGVCLRMRPPSRSLSMSNVSSFQMGFYSYLFLLKCVHASAFILSEILSCCNNLRLLLLLFPLLGLFLGVFGLNTDSVDIGYVYNFG